MTKEEFLTMLNDELEKLEVQEIEAYQKQEYFLQIGQGGIGSKEQQEANYQVSVISSKVNTIRNLVSFPAYARIQAMSEAEISEYKNEKVAELELKIQEINAREEQEKAKLVQLKAQQQELILQFGSLSGNERDNALYRGQQLQAEISRYDSTNQWGVFATIQKEIQEVIRLQEQIKAKTSQEIKTELSADIKANYNRDFAQTVEWASKGVDSSYQLLAAVADNFEKAQQMAGLLTYYRRLDDEQKNVKARLYLGYELPKALEKKLTKDSYYFDSARHETSNPEKLAEMVAEFEGTFNQAKESFQEKYTAKKLSKLVGKEYGVDSSQVDIEFLQEHSDKLTDGELNHLQAIVAQRDKLSKKIFKSKDVKCELDELNARIKNVQSKIYKQIIGWYQSQSKEILGLSYGVSFYNLEKIQQDVERANQDIDRAEKAIAEVKESIQKANIEMKNQKQDYETKKAQVTEQIRTLAGPQFAETQLPYSSDRREDNLDSIVGASMQVQQAEIINRVQQEAQNQADIKESEISGVSIEQLQQMRAEAMVNSEQAIIQTDGEEFTGVMKR